MGGGYGFDDGETETETIPVPGALPADPLKWLTQMTTEPTQPATSPHDRRPRSEPPLPSANRRSRPLIDRFVVTYLRREIRGRLQQALLIALGLGFGVGLLLTATAASTGVSDAQSSVLHSL